MGLAGFVMIEARRIWSSTTGWGFAFDAMLGGSLALLLALAGARLAMAGAPSPNAPSLPAQWERWTVRGRRRRRARRRVIGGIASIIISCGLTALIEAGRFALNRQPSMEALSLIAMAALLIMGGVALLIRQPL